MENPSSSSSSSSPAEHSEMHLGIENEPKALFDKEMKLAREEALEVINNNSQEQALKIFLQGLEPVETSIREEVLISESESEDEDFIDEHDYVVV
ncbi:hypothetical protein CXB51_005895 [Gossypium anomalum]|uniref:Uncharacterized protein n=1 Tax=Gossypium anomalum TaxID=47600 RepID=A0A8J6DCF9_9ROSI|nr:hypothetical protein CXB51_005895 [Gossypium anomalum]